MAEEKNVNIDQFASGLIPCDHIGSRFGSGDVYYLKSN